MTPMDDSLLWKKTAQRRNAAEPIIAGLDNVPRWRMLLGGRRSWGVALALACTAMLGKVCFSQLTMGHTAMQSDDLSRVMLPAFVVDTPRVELRMMRVSPGAPVVTPLRHSAYSSPATAWRKSASAARAGRRHTAATADDVTVLSVLVEHIDAERRRNPGRPPTR